MSNYEGERGPEGLSVYVAGDCRAVDLNRLLSPRTDLMKHTPGGAFECGFKGSGPSQLALAILADHLTDAGEAVDLHLGFRDRAIVNLPRDRRWRLTEGDINTHLEALRTSAQAAGASRMKTGERGSAATVPTI